MTRGTVLNPGVCSVLQQNALGRSSPGQLCRGSRRGVRTCSHTHLGPGALPAQKPWLWRGPTLHPHAPSPLLGVWQGLSPTSPGASFQAQGRHGLVGWAP